MVIIFWMMEEIEIKFFSLKNYLAKHKRAMHFYENELTTFLPYFDFLRKKVVLFKLCQIQVVL